MIDITRREQIKFSYKNIDTLTQCVSFKKKLKSENQNLWWFVM